MAGKPQDPSKRFWSKVNKDGPVPPHMPHLGQCWTWTGSRYGRGYGEFHVYLGPKSYRKVPAHRYSWELVSDPIPEGMDMCHACDNPSCVNPSHLFVGTRSDNHNDAVQKGRRALGEEHHASRLTWQQVREIRERYAAGGVSQKDLAQEYGVGAYTVSALIRGVTWKEKAC